MYERIIRADSKKESIIILTNLEDIEEVRAHTAKSKVSVNVLIQDLLGRIEPVFEWIDNQSNIDYYIEAIEVALFNRKPESAEVWIETAAEYIQKIARLFEIEKVIDDGFQNLRKYILGSVDIISENELERLSEKIESLYNSSITNFTRNFKR